MKRLLSSVAMALVLSGGAAYAASSDGGNLFSTEKFDKTQDFYASDLIGMRIYATESDVADAKGENTDKTDNSNSDNANSDNADSRDDWQDIGEINDLVVSREGKIEAVIVGVGGFLGIGEKDVALNMDQIKVKTSKDGDRFLVVNATKQMFEDADAAEHNENRRSSSSDNANNSDHANNADANREHLTPPDVQRDGYTKVSANDVDVDKLKGSTVYGPGDDSVGEIVKVLRNPGGQPDRAVIDVGGFLGIGDKPVAVPFDELSLLKEKDGDTVRAYISATEDQLEKQPKYEGDI